MPETQEKRVCEYCGGPLIVRGQGAVNCRDCNRPPSEKADDSPGNQDN